jgi:hypothetical protein
MKIKVTFICLFCAFTLRIVAQNKHALVIAIGDYPTYKDPTLNWSDLSSLNDVELLKELFIRQSFKKENVTYLINDKAYTENLQKAFDSITQTLSKGDVFYFHFSGHGQQVADLKPSDFPRIKYLKRDELDGMDETLVLYNAPLKNYEGYNFEGHFYDDQMNHYLTKIQEKLGPSGQVIVVIDACHSGTATRGAEDIVVRGSNVSIIPPGYTNENAGDNSLGFDADLNFQENNALAPMVAFFGCKAEQVNREIRDRNGKGYGSLTFFFTKSFYELKDKSSFQNLFAKINEKMILQFRSEQNPVFEGTNLNSLIFNGALVVQDPFYELLKLDNSSAKINAGQLQGIQIGDSIGFYPNSTTEIKNLKPLFKGLVSEVGIQESTITLVSAYNGTPDSYVKYRAFNINPVNESNIIYLKLNLTSKSLKKEAEKYFKGQPDVRLVESNFSYLLVDTLVQNVTKARVYIGNNQTNPMRGMPFRKIGSIGSFDTLLTEIRQSVRTDVFRKIEVESENINIEMNVLTKDKLPFENGNIVLKDGETFFIELVNNNAFPIYVNLVDIYPNNILVLAPDFKNKLMAPNQRSFAKNSVGEPFGMEQFKLIFTDQPINLSSLENNGSALTRGNNVNPFMEFVDSQTTGTRGRKPSELLNTTVKSISFEIIKP